jgi:steroid delta-isomerase-like uncharacterized protein
LNARDFSSYVAPLDETFTGESGAVPGGVRGPDSVTQQLLMMISAFPDLHIEVEQVIASGDHVVSCVKLTGTHKGTYAGIPATNKTVSWGVCTVSEVRNGKTIKSRLYGDNGSLLRQIGAVSVPGARAAE